MSNRSTYTYTCCLQASCRSQQPCEIWTGQHTCCEFASEVCNLLRDRVLAAGKPWFSLPRVSAGDATAWLACALQTAPHAVTRLLGHAIEQYPFTDDVSALLHWGMLPSCCPHVEICMQGWKGHGWRQACCSQGHTRTTHRHTHTHARARSCLLESDDRAILKVPLEMRAFLV